MRNLRQNNQTLRITCVIGSLGGGGAERVMVNLSTALSELGHIVHLLTTEKDTPDCYNTPESVTRHRLPDGAKTSCRWFDIQCQHHRSKTLRNAIIQLRPDLVISFLDTVNISVLLALRGTGIPTIVAEHIDPRHHSIGWRWAMLRKFTYPWASAVTVLTDSVKAWAMKAWPCTKVYTIPNAISLPEITESTGFPAYFGKCNLIAMGRLTRQKGFDLLLTAFSNLASRLPDWHLTILGEGDDRPMLEHAIEQIGLRERIHLPGRVSEPTIVISHGDLVVLSSRYEGFGMALAEAMAIGLPVVSFDCPSGPSDIIRNNIDGVLVPPGDIGALTSALARLMEDESLRKELANHAPDILERFSQDRVIALWQSLIEEVMSASTFSESNPKGI